MLPAKNRLKLSGKKPTGKSIKIFAPDFVISVRNSRQFKAAVVVSNKVTKKAVERNRIRRTVTEALKNLKLQDVELVIVIKRNIADQKTQEIKSNLETNLKNVIKNS